MKEEKEDHSSLGSALALSVLALGLGLALALWHEWALLRRGCGRNRFLAVLLVQEALLSRADGVDVFHDGDL